MHILIGLCAGFALDLLIGDPSSLPHTVQGIGWLIGRLESVLRKVFPKTNKGEIAAGALMVLLVCLASFGLSFALLWLAGQLHPYLRLALECLMCWQVLAIKSLRDAGLNVYKPLRERDLPSARMAVSMVVGRDTESLSEEGVAKAAIETVAENTGDGIVAPMLAFALGGAPLAILYKAINTMDSMVGYQNERYIYFGRVAARLDDVANYIPARLAGVLMVAAAFFNRTSASGAWRILRRDRRNHKSPNSAWPEAACAGALGIQLGGISNYGGMPVVKPSIGDASREVVPEDILSAVKLEYTVSALCLFFCLCMRIGIIFLTKGWGI